MNSAKHTPLYQQHQELNAQLVDFAGFMMPLSYGQIKKEISAVRNDAGKFDVSHMGEFLLKGKNAIKACDYLITNDFQSEKLKVGMGQYAFLCNEEGLILDDLICYKLADDLVLMCVNASNIEKDKKHIQKVLQEHSLFADVEFQDVSDDYGLIAVQGPKSLEKLGEFAPPADAANFSIHPISYKDSTIFVALTGYTGEKGVELFVPSKHVAEVWSQISLTPCGLAARDTLRLEAGLPLYGQDMDEKFTPLDLNLKFAVKLGKEHFIGLERLKEISAPEYFMVNLALGKDVKAVPRSGYPILDQSGKRVGSITSAGYSPTLERGIGMGSISYSFKDNGPFCIEIRGQSYPCVLCKRSFLAL